MSYDEAGRCYTFSCCRAPVGYIDIRPAVTEEHGKKYIPADRLVAMLVSHISPRLTLFGSISLNQTDFLQKLHNLNNGRHALAIVAH